MIWLFISLFFAIIRCGFHYTDCKIQSSLQLRASHGLKVPVMEVCEGKEKWGCNGQCLSVRVRMAGGDLFLRV